MTRFQKIKARAAAFGVKAVQDKYCSPRGYWLLNPDGSPVWEGESFAGSLSELETMVDDYANERS